MDLYPDRSRQFGQGGFWGPDGQDAYCCALNLDIVGKLTSNASAEPGFREANLRNIRRPNGTTQIEEEDYPTRKFRP